MGNTSNIEWTDVTWNVARGCDKVSPGCKFCYMMRDSLDGTRYNPFTVQRTKTVFTLPLKYKGTKSKVWDGPPLVFTSSLTDFFHQDIDAFRHEAWEIIRRCPHLVFQILTKRPERIRECLPADWGNGYPNVWLGVSVENQKYANQRIPVLMEIPAVIRFLSIEPLLGAVDLTRVRMPDDPEEPEAAYYLNVFNHNGYYECEFKDGGNMPADGPVLGNIHWVIVGGETGNGKVPNDTSVKYGFRESRIEWFGKIVQDCKDGDMPVFVKQMGTHLSKILKMKDRAGKDINEFPPHLQFREMPANG